MLSQGKQVTGMKQSEGPWARACICIMPAQGRFPVASSHSSTPKLYTSVALLSLPAHNQARVQWQCCAIAGMPQHSKFINPQGRGWAKPELNRRAQASKRSMGAHQWSVAPAACASPYLRTQHPGTFKPPGSAYDVLRMLQDFHTGYAC